MNAERFKSVEDAYRFLEQIPMFGTRGISAANFSLDAISTFCRETGNPQNQFKTIHVAGTNGKGTVCRMLATVYISAGYKTGLYTSPHLLDIKERFQINAEQISDDQLLQFFREHGNRAEKYKLTYFELTTAIAFWYFSTQKVDIAIIETGLGGRLDATNIITPIVSVITSIGTDHTEILGDTIEEIAAEKAGIIKPGVPVVIGNLQPSAEQVIRRRAEDLGSVCIKSTEPEPRKEQGIILIEDGKIRINGTKRPEIDTVNCAITMCAAKLTGDQAALTDTEFTEGIEKLDERFPIRAHFAKIHPEWNWYFDASHNAEALKILVNQLQQKAPPEEWTLVLSMMKDKLNREVASILSAAGTILIYPLATERAASERELKEYFPRAALLKAEGSLPDDWIEKHKSELVIFSGSFYFYSTVRRWMGAIAANK